MSIKQMPNGWSLRKLKEIADFKNGKGHEKFIAEDGSYIVVNSKYISTEGDVKKFSNENLSPLEKDTITLVMSDIPNGKALAKCFYIDNDNKYTLNQRICSIVSKSNIESRFLYYSLNRNKYFLAFDNGVGQTNLKKDEVLSCPIPLPPLPEQQKIADILSTVDKKIAVIDQQIIATEELKKGLMQRLLTKGIGHTEFKDSPLGKIPKSWEVKTFSELIEEKTISGIQDGNHGESHPKSDDFVSEGIPFIMANCLSADGDINLNKAKRISKKQYDSLRIGFAKPDDVLLSHKGSIGLTAIVKEVHGELMLTPQVTYYRIQNTDKLSINYLYNFFQSQIFQLNLRKYAKQSTRDYIGITNQKKLMITIPNTLEEQNQICNILSSIDSKLNIQHSKLKSYHQLKKGLMQQLLTGKIRVNNLIEA